MCMPMSLIIVLDWTSILSLCLGLRHWDTLHRLVWRINGWMLYNSASVPVDMADCYLV